MERESDSENRITKTERFSWRTTKKLRRSENVDRNSKRSYKEAVWQKEKKFTRIEGWR